MMERVVTRHRDHVVSMLSGFDRLLFRGTFRSVSFTEGMDKFLSSQRVLYKDFGAFAEQISARVIAHAKGLAARTGRPYVYVRSGGSAKEDCARQILTRDGLTDGLVCILSCVEPCGSFTIRRDRDTKRLRLVSGERKCLHLYFYYLDRDVGLMHVRVQTWLPLAIQVCVNGREWLARQMPRAGLGYTQVDHAFTALDAPPRGPSPRGPAA